MEKKTSLLTQSSHPFTGGILMNKQEHEEKLAGGNVSSVYRAGDTVRREQKPNSKRVHELLQHLERKNYMHAPKFLGIDDQNREVLSFIEGEAGNYPLKSYMWSNEALKEVANMLRLYHDAVSDFPVSDDWQPMDNAPQSAEVICHNDFAIYNLIFDGQLPVGVIDFDLIAPGPRLWDIAYTLYTCVPLSRHYHTEEGKEVRYDPMMDAKEKKERVDLFFDAYGIEGLKEGYLDMVVLRLEGLCQYMKRKAAEGDPAFQKMVDEGHYEHYQTDIEFIQKHGSDWI